MWLACALGWALAAGAEAPPGADAALHREVTQLRTLAAEVEAGAVPPEEILARTEAALDRADAVVTSRGVPPAVRAYTTRSGRWRGSAQRVAAARAALLAAADRLEGFARVEQLPARGAGSSGDVRAALTAELADDMYGVEGADAMDRAWAAMSQWMGRLFERAMSDDVAPWMQRVSYFIMVVCLIAACGLLAWLYVTRYRRRPGPPAEAESPVVSTHRMADPHTYRLAAGEHAAAGRFREAVRALFLMTLAELEGRELVAFDRTRTNGEYVRQLHRRVGAGDLLRHFMTVTRAYDRAWYGSVPCSGDEYAVFAKRVESTVRLAGGAG